MWVHFDPSKKKNPLRSDSEWVGGMCLIYNVISIMQSNPIYLYISKSVCTFNTNRYVNTLTSQERPKRMQ